MMRTHPNSAAYPAMAAAIEYAALGIAVVQSHWPTAPTGQSHLDSAPMACSCGDANCPTPAEHPVTSIGDATVNIAQVIGRWSTSPLANVATPAGRSFDVLECRHAGTGEQLVTWLAEQGAEPGPVIDLGNGRLRFPVRGGRLADTGVEARRPAHCLPGNALVLLPPSRLVDGRKVRWLQPFDDRVALLPERDRLLDLLAQLPGTAPDDQRSDPHREADLPTRRQETCGHA